MHHLGRFRAGPLDAHAVPGKGAPYTQIQGQRADLHLAPGAIEMQVVRGCAVKDFSETLVLVPELYETVPAGRSFE